jgi:hypothetical protein
MKVRLAVIALLVCCAWTGFAEEEQKPYSLDWTVVTTGRSVQFDFVVTDRESGETVTSPRLNTQTQFAITDELESRPGTKFVISGKPIAPREWSLTFKAIRGDVTVQTTTYTATIP